MDEILAPVIRLLLFHESLFRLEGLDGGGASWRGVISGLEVLVLRQRSQGWKSGIPRM
jgi:ubiquitin conjugation factor E4 B